MANQTIIEDKQELRSRILKMRDGLAIDWRIEASMNLAAYGEAIDVLGQEIVSGFLPIRSEVALRPLMHSLRQKGARLCLPDVVDKETIVFRNFTRETALVKAAFGTLVPSSDEAILDPSLMLVPLSAFDKSGARLGYGGGYYDRAIERLIKKGIKPRLIGVAFACQEVEAVPIETHDIKLDAVLTENGLQTC